MLKKGFKHGVPKNYFFYLFAEPFVKTYIHWAFNVHFTGKENIPSQGGCIIAANHISLLDPVLISASSGRIMHFMAKSELFENPFSALFLKNFNAFPVKRGRYDKKAIDYAIDIINGGGVLGIFPEGTISKDGKLHKAKGGAGLIAKKCKCPVVPASIYSSNRAKPGARITVRYGKAIPYEAFDFDETSEKMRDLHKFSVLIMNKISELWEMKF